VTELSTEEILTEWKQAQKILKQFDDYLHDIRKYGFSFVTGLLTVDALLGSMEPTLKLAALTGTMALVAVLFVIDRNYRVFLAAANLRDTQLERRSSPELARTISRVYEGQRVGAAFVLVYVGLATVTLLLGFLVVTDPRLLGYLFIFYISSLAIITLIERSLYTRPYVYCDIDGFTYKEKTSILATVANFGSKPFTLEEGLEVWAVYAEDDVSMEHPKLTKKVDKSIEVRHDSDHRWKIDTKVLDSGLYRLVYKGPRWIRVPYLPIFGAQSLSHFDLLEKKSAKWHKEEAWDSALRFRIIDY